MSKRKVNLHSPMLVPLTLRHAILQLFVVSKIVLTTDCPILDILNTKHFIFINLNVAN